MKELRDRMAEQLACVDGVNRFALVALDPEQQDEIIAVVRFDRQGDIGKGEYAALRGGSLARTRVGFSYDLPANRCGSG
jgi:alkylhydroperoxidase family enzyme